MYRFMSVAFVGLALAGASTVAAAQSAGQGQPVRAGRAGMRGEAGRARLDSSRVRQSDSARAARGDTSRVGGRRGWAGARGALAGITLTSAQKATLKDIHKKYGAQLKQLRGQNAGQAATSNTQRAQFQSIMEQERAEIRGVLTSDQRGQFDANVAKMRNQKGKHGKPLARQK